MLSCGCSAHKSCTALARGPLAARFWNRPVSSSPVLYFCRNYQAGGDCLFTSYLHPHPPRFASASLILEARPFTVTLVSLLLPHSRALPCVGKPPKV